MLAYIIRRLIIGFFMLIGVALVSFIVIQLPPGDFASRYRAFLLAQGGVSVADADHAAQMVRVQYGLDKPKTEQFFLWIEGMVTKGNFGYSFAYAEDVKYLIADRLPKTIFLALLCHLVSTILGVGLGIFVAPRKYSFTDNV
jgi:peptide/nickel transport system permease protein